MKTIPEALATGLSAGVMRHALCWRLTRADGAVVGVTEHDRALVVDGVSYAPGAAMEGARFAARAGLAPDPAGVRGALSSAAITAEDIEAGLWDGARVDVLRVDWQAPEAAALTVWSGRLTGLTRRGAAFEAELVSLKGDLEAPLGRVIARACDAELGDARCGLDVTGPEWAGVTCDKRFATCVERFANAENFRGFPDLIGNDALVSGPDGARDGGSRRR